MVGFQKPSCWCCFNRKQKPQFMRTIFVSTVNDKLLLIYDKEKNKGKKKKSGASTKREGYSFQLSSAISMEIKKNALISKVSKYTNQVIFLHLLSLSISHLRMNIIVFWKSASNSVCALSEWMEKRLFVSFPKFSFIKNFIIKFS